MKKPVVIVLILLGLVTVAFLYLYMNKKRYNWFENYSHKSDQPFGTLFFHELLKSYAQDGFIHNTKKSLPELLDSASNKEPSTYLSIGHGWDTDSLGLHAIKQYLAAGNDAIIICNYPPREILDALYKSECTGAIGFNHVETEKITANFYHTAFARSKPYAFTHRIKNEETVYFWQSADSNAWCDQASSIIPLGSFDEDHVNFFKIPYEKGNLYIHTNPLLFTNYFLTQERNTEYVSSVISHSPNRKIIWDSYQKGFSFQRNASSYSNPLYYIMEQPALRYAWWLLVVLGLLYVIFTGKRQQRFIPVIEKKANSSLAFMKMVSSLHYRNRSHIDMARKKMRFFLHTVRTRYGLQTHTLDNVFIEKLALKSLVDQTEIELIFQQYKIIDNFQDIDSAPLENLHTAIQNFYNKAK